MAKWVATMHFTQGARASFADPTYLSAVSGVDEFRVGLGVDSACAARVPAITASMYSRVADGDRLKARAPDSTT